jgi:hypothetical protein
MARDLPTGSRRYSRLEICATFDEPAFRWSVSSVFFAPLRLCVKVSSPPPGEQGSDGEAGEVIGDLDFADFEDDEREAENKHATDGVDGIHE